LWKNAISSRAGYTDATIPIKLDVALGLEVVEELNVGIQLGGFDVGSF
jgi:hypothetical protein